MDQGNDIPPEGSAERGRGPVSGLFTSVAQMLATVIGIAHTRLELLTTELQEEMHRVAEIMVYTAIDHFRKYQKHQVLTQLDNVVYQVSSVEEDALEKISYEEIIRSVQLLSPGYRTVFNLFVIDGWSHDEIANHLGISTGTSKSNLSKARRQLQKILFKQNEIQIARNAV